MSEELVEKLRQVDASRPEYAGIQTCWYRNPEGPEAADLIEAQDAKIKALTEALLLWDMQARSWLKSRAECAKPGWMQPAIDKGAAALKDTP